MHEVVLSVEIVHSVNGTLERVSLPIDLKRIGDPKAFEAGIRGMNSGDFKIWCVGHMVKDGNQISTSIIIPDLAKALHP